MGYVVGVGVEARHRGVVVETLQQQALMVEIGKTYGTVQREHTSTAAPLGNAIQQSLKDSIIVYKVEPAEATLLDAPSLVCPMIYDAGDAADYLLVAICQIEHKVAHFECGIAFRVKRI